MSTGSVGSNTPSVVGENLESFSLGDEAKSKVTASGANGGVMVGGPVVKNTEPPLRRSLFSHTPPSINFVHHNEVPETPLPAELRKNLRWKLSTFTPAVMKKVVTNTGFRLVSIRSVHVCNLGLCQTVYNSVTDAQELHRVGRDLGQAHEERHVQGPQRRAEDQPLSRHLQHREERSALEELPQAEAQARQGGVQLLAPNLLPPG